MNPIYRKARFLLSAPDVRHLPPDTGREVAFAGRSNAGKSSAINTITGQKALARTSKTPGRTQQINVFPVCEQRYLIDLPGYGFAKLPQAIRAHWQRALPEYLQKRQSLCGLMIIMDVRHPLTTLDQQMLVWCREAELPVHVVLTKADKLKQGPATHTLRHTAQWLTEHHRQTTVQLFSATRGRGIDEVHAKLDDWLRLAPETDGECGSAPADDSRLATGNDAAAPRHSQAATDGRGGGSKSKGHKEKTPGAMGGGLPGQST